VSAADHRRRAAEIQIEMRRLAEELELHLRAAQEWDELERLHPPGDDVNVKAMTSQQAQARGAAIARSLAGKDPLLMAIVASPWGSAERYAKERLGVTGAALSQWRKGKRKVPSRVADLVKLDFGLSPTKTLWPAGVAD